MFREQGGFDAPDQPISHVRHGPVSEFDRTHVLNTVLSYDLGRRWRVGSRLVFYTGTPYSHLEGSQPIPPYNNTQISSRTFRPNLQRVRTSMRVRTSSSRRWTRA